MANPAKPARFRSLPGSHNLNIMLDLETACSGLRTKRPAIIEIAAVHFNLQTGVIYDEFRENINLKSCVERGLVADKDPDTMTEPEKRSDRGIDNTISWLKKNIPDIYRKSLSLDTSSPLPDVLRRFTGWIRQLTQALPTSNHFVVLWGKPSVYDNVWIANAYAACGLRQPWNRNMCCDTVIQVCFLTTGVLFSDKRPGNEIFEGTKHYALDDCKHQVRMLVKAINFQKPAHVGTAETIPTPAVNPPPLPVPPRRQEPLFSPSSIEVLNSLMESFHTRTGSPPHILEAARLSDLSTIEDIESNLQTIAKLMEESTKNDESPAGETNLTTQGKRKRTNADPELDHQREADPTANAISVAPDNHGSVAKFRLPRSNDEQVEGPSEYDYGDSDLDEDLSQIFHSFTE